MINLDGRGRLKQRTPAANHKAKTMDARPRGAVGGG